MSFSRLLVTVSCASLFLGTQLHSQRSLPFGDDALALGFGQIRAGIHGEWQYYDQVYSGSDSSSLTPFGSFLSFPAIGTSDFPALAAYEAGIRDVSGQSSFQLSLGTSDVRATHRTGSTALQLDVGLPGRFMISAEVPFVRIETTVGISVNSDANSANVGVNPALTSSSVFAADTLLANQIARARNTLNSQLSSCAGSAAPECASVNARRNDAQALVSRAISISNGLLLLASAPYVPLLSSTTQTAITAQIAAIASSFRSFGINTVTGTSLAAANVPITDAQFRQLLESSSIGAGGTLPSYKSLTRLGDINVSARFKIADTRNIRAVALGRIYFPTGGQPSSGELLPLAAGEGATRTEIGGIADFFLGSRASLTAAGAASRRAGRTGFNVAVTPRYAANSWVTLGLQYQARRMSADSFSYPNQEELALRREQPASTENRFGFGFSFSNLSSTSSRTPRFPVEASFLHAQSVGGSGFQPRIFSDEIRIRIFARR